MRIIGRSSTYLLAATLMLACGDSQPAGEVDRGAAPSGRSSATLGAGASDAEADLRELADYELNMEDLQKYTVAQLNILRVSQGMDEETEAGDDADAVDDTAPGRDPNSLDGMTERVESIPEMRKAVEDAGLDAREYATIALTYMTSAMATGMVKMGQSVDSVANAMKVNPDNIQFILKHEAQIARLMDDVKIQAGRIEGGR